MPNLFFTEEQSTKLAQIESTLMDYVEEMEAKFITGDTDIDKEWDKYVETLQSIGLEEYVGIYQEAYNEKYK